MIPSGYKEDVVYSQIPTSGAGDLSFTRASNGTRVNSAGLVEVCPWNLVQSSETFNLSPWATNAGATITNTTQIAPNGTATADILSASTNTSSGIYQVVTGNVVGQVYTASLYVKNDSGATSIKYQEENCAAGILFNAVTGAITGTFGTVISSSVENVGNGWYRIQFAYTSTITTNVFIIYSTLGSANTFVLWGAQVNIGSTAKPYFPTTDRLNVPRLTYQNGGGGCPSLLLEKQSTNLFTYSEQLDNGAWFTNGLTVTANQGVSPDGTQNADLLDDGTASSTQHWIYQGPSFSNSTAYTISFYAKYVSRKNMTVNIYNGSTSQYVVYDIQNGVVVGSTGDVTASITSVGNGWYRVVYTRTMAASGSPNFRIAMADDSGSETYTGSNKQVYLWGMQCEASSYPTSYIVTTSSSATRVADACFKTGISSLIGQTEGVMFVNTQFSQYAGSGNDVWLMECVNDDTSNGILMYAVNNTSIYVYINNGSTSVNLNGTGDIRQPLKVAVAYKSGDFALYINGTLQDTDTSSFTFPSNINQMGLAKWVGLPTERPIQYNQAILFPTRLTNAELASLTTI